jgi:hypothetical protein
MQATTLPMRAIAVPGGANARRVLTTKRRLELVIFAMVTNVYACQRTRLLRAGSGRVKRHAGRDRIRREAHEREPTSDVR